MSSLYLFQFAALVFMLVNALFVALARLNARWKNKRYERSRLMIFLALVLLSAQYYVQMRFHIRATDDHLGAMVNMLVYTPCFGLIAWLSTISKPSRPNGATWPWPARGSMLPSLAASPLATI